MGRRKSPRLAVRDNTCSRRFSEMGHWTQQRNKKSRTQGIRVTRWRPALISGI